MSESQASYIRRHNVDHYRKQILTVTDETQRRMLEKLLAEEQQKQRDFGDINPLE